MGSCAFIYPFKRKLYMMNCVHWTGCNQECACSTYEPKLEVKDSKPRIAFKTKIIHSYVMDHICSLNLYSVLGF